MRAWRYAERNGYHVDRCRRIGINAQAARQVGPLFEQFLRIAAEEGLDISEKPIDNAPCSVACWLVSPTISPSVWTPARCVANWSMAGAACWPARAS